MAVYSADSLTKKNNKFENFLKRNLDETAFDKVRAYEACIVCWYKENKAFKYVVLSDESLYLTENPPKTIAEAVRLEDIYDIELIDDLPPFLSGQEQHNTTHIEISFWSYPVGDKVKVKADGVASGPPITITLDSGDRALRSGSAALRSGSAVGRIEDGELSSSMPETSLKSALKNDAERLRSRSSKKVTMKAVDAIETASLPGGRISRSLPSLPVDRAGSHSSSPELGSAQSTSPLNGSVHSNGSLSNGSTLNTSKGPAGQPHSDGSLNDGFKRKKMKLHLYMLVPESNMLVLIRSAVNNHLMKSTLMKDEEYALRVLNSPRRVKQNLEKINTLFTGLSKDLLDPNNSMERTFELVKELKTATDKYFHLKKLFWKNGDLFSLFVLTLKRYLPKSPSNINSDVGRASRADEFDFIILVTQTLGMMFRETEIFPSRLRVLRANSGRKVCDLIEALTSFPEMPVKYIPPTTKASKLLMQTEADKWKCLADAELHELFVEFTSASTTVLFELLVIAQQSHWGQNETDFFNVSWLMNFLVNLNTTERFLERIIAQAMKNVQPSKRTQLSPADAILTFQQFYILQKIVTYSPSLASFIRNNYTEEFKYYIQGPVLQEKLPLSYPISPRTILLIEEVMRDILQRKVSLLDDLFQ